MIVDRMTTIESVRAEPGKRLAVRWDDGRDAELDLSAVAGVGPFAALSDADVFAQVRVGDWGHSLVWPGDVEIGADSLWLDSLTSWGLEDARAFMEWRLRNGLSVGATAEALGLSPRVVGRYSAGERVVPRSILLACKGWDVLKAA